MKPRAVSPRPRAGIEAAALGRTSHEVVGLARDLLGGQRTSPSTIDSSTNLREEENT